MKDFFKWFKSSSKMKRWIFLMLIGTVGICYAISMILVMKELNFVDLVRIVLMFALGFTSFIVSVVFLQKRILELLVEETDSRNIEESNVKSLIFNKKVYNHGPKIVVIGGGTGLNSVLKGLKKYTDNLTAIVTVSDYGEELSDSRRLLEVLPFEDIKESLIALASNDEAMGDLMEYKFSNGRLNSLSFGDIYLLAMQNIHSNLSQAVEQSKEVLGITGKVLPVTLEEIKICAELQDGTIIESRSKIPEVVNEKASKISRIYVNPTNTKAAPGVIEAIQEADAIVIGPGSLYTNVIPNLLIKGVTKAIKENKGFKIYISNIMTEPGQTDNYTLSEHLKAINDHTGGNIVDYCIYDTGDIIPEFIRKYNMDGAELVEQDIEIAKEQGANLIKRDLATIDKEFIRHNPDAIASSIIELICEDLKFNDKQNEFQYLSLNNILKDTKKMLEKKKDDNIVKKNKNIKKKSKFLNKYYDRIESIKESDKKVTQSKVSKKSEQAKAKSKKVKELEEEEKKKFISAVNNLRK